MKKPITIGIDEVGRGALAGPLVVAALAKTGRVRLASHRLGKIRDSKRLTKKRREEWFFYLTTHPGIAWRAARVSPAVIDRINVSRAANAAACRLVKRFFAARCFALLDGGLKLPDSVPHRTIIKGDERLPLIAAASIIAKVFRDRLMASLHRKFPAYGFKIHKGYATRLHQRAIRRYGPSSIHRKTFLTKLW